NFANYESRIHRHIKQTLLELKTIEQLLPQLDEPGIDPSVEDADEPGPYSTGPQIIPFPHPSTDPVTTEKTNEPECDSTPVESAPCSPRNFKPKPLAPRVPYPIYHRRKSEVEQTEKVMVAGHARDTQCLSEVSPHGVV
ncbi:MAG: hypothetical protein ABI693_33360, partial [Bryobacteraceae bacterium]